MERIRVYSWKPANSSNFGDEIGPMIVAKLCAYHGISVEVKPTISQTHKKLLAVGSVLHEARGSDVVWGVGINSKNRFSLPVDSKINFRAVRGPLTRAIVMDNGFACPPIYGDPGLIFPMLFDKEIRTRRSELETAAKELGASMPEIIVVPNINDDRFLSYYSSQEVPDNAMFVRPNLDPITVAAFISAAKIVVSSSLHGLVFAEVYGRETIRMTSQYEPEFKYTDYYHGTNRDVPLAYPDVTTALSGASTSKLDWDPLPLLNAFPLADPDLSSLLIENSFDFKRGKVTLVSELADGESPFGNGWSKPENGSVWSTEVWNNFDFVVRDDDLTSKSVLKIRVGTLEKGKGAFEVLRIVHAGALISSHRINRGEATQIIEIPLPPTKAGDEVNLSFKVENASSPKDFSDSLDERKLGIWVSQIELG